MHAAALRISHDAALMLYAALQGRAVPYRYSRYSYSYEQGAEYEYASTTTSTRTRTVRYSYDQGGGGATLLVRPTASPGAIWP